MADGHRGDGLAVSPSSAVSPATRQQRRSLVVLKDILSTEPAIATPGGFNALQPKRPSISPIVLAATSPTTKHNAAPMAPPTTPAKHGGGVRMEVKIPASHSGSAQSSPSNAMSSRSAKGVTKGFNRAMSFSSTNRRRVSMASYDRTSAVRLADALESSLVNRIDSSSNLPRMNSVLSTSGSVSGGGERGGGAAARHQNQAASLGAVPMSARSSIDVTNAHHVGGVRRASRAQRSSVVFAAGTIGGGGVIGGRSASMSEGVTPEDLEQLGVVGPLDELDPFTPTLALLARLKKVWDSAHLNIFDVRARLQPIVDSLRILTSEEEFQRDERKRMALIMEQREELTELCMQLAEEPADIQAATLGQMSLTQIVDSLRLTLGNLRQESKTRTALLGRLQEKIKGALDELGEDDLSTDDPKDLSKNRIRRLENRIDDLRKSKDERATLIRSLVEEICHHWAEQGYNPVLSPPNDDEEATFFKNIYNYRRMKKPALLGLTLADLHRVTAFRDKLAGERECRRAQRERLLKRLKVIEDRQHHVQQMARISKSHNDPRRLFGSSVQMVEDQKFRKVAYRKLLTLEVRLRAALLEWQRIEGTPYLHEDKEYLHVLEQQIKGRKISTDLFPRTGVPRGVSVKFDDLKYVREESENYINTHNIAEDDQMSDDDDEDMSPSGTTTNFDGGTPGRSPVLPASLSTPRVGGGRLSGVVQSPRTSHKGHPTATPPQTLRSRGPPSPRRTPASPRLAVLQGSPTAPAVPVVPVPAGGGLIPDVPPAAPPPPQLRGLGQVIAEMPRKTGQR